MKRLFGLALYLRTVSPDPSNLDKLHKLHPFFFSSGEALPIDDRYCRSACSSTSGKHRQILISVPFSIPILKLTCSEFGRRCQLELKFVKYRGPFRTKNPRYERFSHFWEHFLFWGSKMFDLGGRKCSMWGGRKMPEIYI